jgi:hypothetical protein
MCLGVMGSVLGLCRISLSRRINVSLLEGFGGFGALVAESRMASLAFGDCTTPQCTTRRWRVEIRRASCTAQ